MEMPKTQINKFYVPQPENDITVEIKALDENSQAFFLSDDCIDYLIQTTYKLNCSTFSTYDESMGEMTQEIPLNSLGQLQEVLTSLAYIFKSTAFMRNEHGQLVLSVSLVPFNWSADMYQHLEPVYSFEYGVIDDARLTPAVLNAQKILDKLLSDMLFTFEPAEYDSSDAAN